MVECGIRSLPLDGSVTSSSMKVDESDTASTEPHKLKNAFLDSDLSATYSLKSVV
jgi:hypothetical protein